ncbi:MAG: hypothetical protein GYB65_05405 [Chloroflexi bacterium]|nr:hypothetical protein [Chloroflexota bacterium]
MAAEKCKFMDGCPIVQYFGRQGWEKYIEQYCSGDYRTCQRFQVQHSGQPAPTHLLPWDAPPIRKDNIQ